MSVCTCNRTLTTRNARVLPVGVSPTPTTVQLARWFLDEAFDPLVSDASRQKRVRAWGPGFERDAINTLKTRVGMNGDYATARNRYILRALTTSGGTIDIGNEIYLGESDSVVAALAKVIKVPGTPRILSTLVHDNEIVLTRPGKLGTLSVSVEPLTDEQYVLGDTDQSVSLLDVEIKIAKKIIIVLGHILAVRESEDLMRKNHISKLKAMFVGEQHSIDVDSVFGRALNDTGSHKRDTTQDKDMVYDKPGYDRVLQRLKKDFNELGGNIGARAFVAAWDSYAWLGNESYDNLRKSFLSVTDTMVNGNATRSGDEDTKKVFYGNVANVMVVHVITRWMYDDGREMREMEEKYELERIQREQNELERIQAERDETDRVQKERDELERIQSELDELERVRLQEAYAKAQAKAQAEAQARAQDEERIRKQQDDADDLMEFMRYVYLGDPVGQGWFFMWDRNIDSATTLLLLHDLLDKSTEIDITNTRLISLRDTLAEQNKRSDGRIAKLLNVAEIEKKLRSWYDRDGHDALERANNDGALGVGIPTGAHYTIHDVVRTYMLQSDGLKRNATDDMSSKEYTRKLLFGLSADLAVRRMRRYRLTMTTDTDMRNPTALTGNKDLSSTVANRMTIVGTDVTTKKIEGRRVIETAVSDIYDSAFMRLPSVVALVGVSSNGNGDGNGNGTLVEPNPTYAVHTTVEPSDGSISTRLQIDRENTFDWMIGGSGATESAVFTGRSDTWFDPSVDVKKLIIDNLYPQKLSDVDDVGPDTEYLTDAMLTVGKRAKILSTLRYSRFRESGSKMTGTLVDGERFHGHYGMTVLMFGYTVSRHLAE